MALAPNGSGIETSFFLSPNTMYYVALYGLVILVRFFKLKKEGSADAPFDVKRVFHVGLELVYTASGLVVLLLVDLKDYAAFIVIGYLSVVIISSQIETMSERFSKVTVFLTHIAILLLVLVTTVWYFQAVQPEVEKAARTAKAHRHFRVAIPYQDMALREHLGATFGSRQLVYITDVEASDEFEAKQKAKSEFKEKVSPFESRRRKSTVDDVIAHIDQIIAKPID